VDLFATTLCGAVGTAIGACVRVAARDAVVARGYESWRSTLTVNLVGSVVAGVLVDVATHPAADALIIGGFLGGLTTFSSMAVESIALWMAGCRRLGVAIIAATVALGPVGAWLGALGVWAFKASSGSAAATIAPLRHRAPSVPRTVPNHLSGLALVSAGAVFGGMTRTGAVALASLVGVPQWMVIVLLNIVGSAVAGFTFRFLNAVGPEGEPLRSRGLRLTVERTVVLGFAGGMTSLSALSIDVMLAADRSLLEALGIAGAHLALALPGAIAGWWMASRLCPNPPAWVRIVTPQHE